MIYKTIIASLLITSSLQGSINHSGNENFSSNYEYMTFKHENFQIKFDNMMFLLNKMSNEFKNSKGFPRFFFEIITSPYEYIDDIMKYGVIPEDLIDSEFTLTLLSTLNYIDITKIKNTQIEDVLYIAQSIQIFKDEYATQNITEEELEEEIGNKNIEMQNNIHNETLYLLETFNIEKR